MCTGLVVSISTDVTALAEDASGVRQMYPSGSTGPPKKMVEGVADDSIHRAMGESGSMWSTSSGLFKMTPIDPSLSEWARTRTTLRVKYGSSMEGRATRRDPGRISMLA
jgi:hypothetical protein